MAFATGWGDDLPMFDPAEEAADGYGEAWASVYDEEYRSRVVPEAQLDLLAELTGDGRALELGVGTGRVALPLAARGLRVEGIDASPSMLDRFRAKPGAARVPVTLGDMRDPDVDGPFALVYVVFNTLFNLVSQRAQIDCFRSVANLLDDDGAFVVECFVPDLGRFERGQSLMTVGLGNDRVRIDAALHDPVNQTVGSNLITVVEGTALSVRPVRLRYAWPSELDLMAELAGLRLERRAADWDGQPFGATSGSHVTVYRKRAR